MTERKLVKILSIDGGGVRGIIPAYVLRRLEGMLPEGKHLSDCFDIIAGTSIGGILALSYASGIKSDTVYELIKYQSSNIFCRTLIHKIKTLGGLIGPKYDNKNIVNSIFGREDVRFPQYLNDLKTNVIVPAYCISENKTYLFSNAFYKLSNVGDVIMATSAAPTYFSPWEIHGKYYIDGGVSVNNPTMIAAMYAKEIFKNDMIPVPLDLFIVSLGTGTIYGYKDSSNSKDYSKLKIAEWAEEIISIMLSSENSMTDYESSKIVDGGFYYRFQPSLAPKNFDIDNASPENIDALIKFADSMCLEREKDLERIAEVISK